MLIILYLHREHRDITWEKYKNQKEKWKIFPREFTVSWNVLIGLDIFCLVLSNHKVNTFPLDHL